MEPISTDLLLGLPAILMAAQEGSATRAGARLGVTTATALRRIEGAEEALGVRLFERLPTGLEPTEALGKILPWAEQVVAATRGMLKEVADGLLPEAGVVRVTSPPVVSSHLLAPAAKALREAHPRITLELAGSNTMVHMERLEADIAIRGQKPTQGDLVVRKLVEFDLVVAGAEALVSGCRSRALEELPWLSWERGLHELPESVWLAQAVPGAQVVLRAAEFNTLLGAAQAGLGVILMPAALARLQGLTVVEACPPYGPRGALWMVAHRALRDVARVSIVWDWLVSYFQALEELEG